MGSSRPRKSEKDTQNGEIVKWCGPSRKRNERVGDGYARTAGSSDRQSQYPKSHDLRGPVFGEFLRCEVGRRAGCVVLSWPASLSKLYGAFNGPTPGRRRQHFGVARNILALEVGHSILYVPFQLD